MRSKAPFYVVLLPSTSVHLASRVLRTVQAKLFVFNARNLPQCSSRKLRLPYGRYKDNAYHQRLLPNSIAFLVVGGALRTTQCTILVVMFIAIACASRYRRSLRSVLGSLFLLSSTLPIMYLSLAANWSHFPAPPPPPLESDISSLPETQDVSTYKKATMAVMAHTSVGRGTDSNGCGLGVARHVSAVTKINRNLRVSP